MTWVELHSIASDAISEHERLGLPGQPTIVLVIKRAWRRQRRMHLAGPGSPKGEPLAMLSDGETSVRFDAREVLVWAEPGVRQEVCGE